MAKDNTLIYVGLAAAAFFFWQRSGSTTSAVSDIAVLDPVALPGDAAIAPGEPTYQTGGPLRYKPKPIRPEAPVLHYEPGPGGKIRKPLAPVPIDYRPPLRVYDWNLPEGEGVYYKYTRPGYLGPPVRATTRQD